MENQEFNNDELVILSAKDADEDSNSGPYSYDLRCSDEYPRCSQFSLQSDSSMYINLIDFGF
jgi:hypothetical protein